MPVKKTTTAAPKKASGSGSSHSSYQDMVKDAILQLKERNGSSRQAIQKYIKANNNLGETSDNLFKSHVNRAIATGEKNGDFLRPKGPSGTVKLAKKESKPAAKKTGETKAKKPAATKAKTTTATKEKKAATTAAPKEKKATAAATKEKKTTTAAAAKPKANASKPRKTATKEKDAPAVEAEVSKVLGKTKSGRVTKTKAPAAAKPAAKKAAATKEKKAPAKKAAATKEKKASTPKKATPKKTEA